jgi:hypothetical protein
LDICFLLVCAADASQKKPNDFTDVCDLPKLKIGNKLMSGSRFLLYFFSLPKKLVPIIAIRFPAQPLPKKYFL